MPFATLNIRDSQVVVPAVEVVDKMSYWDGSSDKSDISFVACLNSDRIWQFDPFGPSWKCEEDGYELEVGYETMCATEKEEFDA